MSTHLTRRPPRDLFDLVREYNNPPERRVPQPAPAPQPVRPRPATRDAELEELRTERAVMLRALWIVATGREDRVVGMPANLGPSRLMDVAVAALERIGEI